MANPTCSKCDVGWEILTHEHYCGYCGCPVYGFSVDWQREPLLYGKPEDIDYPLTLVVANKGACPIAFQQIQIKHPNVTLPSEEYQKPFTIAAGQSYEIPIQVKTAGLAEFTEVITVQTQEIVPGRKCEESLSLRVYPPPDFRLNFSPELRYPKGTKKVVMNLSVKVVSGRFYIKTVKRTAQWIQRIGFSTERHEEGQRMKNVKLVIDCKQLKEGVVNKTSLSFHLHDHPQPIEITKDIQVQAEVLPDPPKFSVEPANWEVTQDFQKNCHLTFRNLGEQPLIVRKIAFASNAPGLAQLSNIDFPLEIEGGTHQNVNILVSAKGIQPGIYTVNFNVNSNCAESQEYKGTFDVEVRLREEYPYPLAIDFGTTNSCCAYIDSAKLQPKLIPLDKENPPEIMPSSIVYLRYPRNGNRYDVGYDADTARTSNTDVYITSVKRWLGFRWQRQFPNGEKFQPRDVAAHILKHIIERAEAHLDSFTTESKITKCVITHPTMFSQQQQRDLREVFQNIGITDLILIDEASAAAIGTVLQHDEKTTKDHRFLVYDFGGGTIDIVLSQITIDDQGLTIEPLARGGNPTFGGDDVTQKIIDFVMDELSQRIQKAKPNCRFDIPYLKRRKILQPSGNPDIDQATRRNTGDLYREAEIMKKELSEHKEVDAFFFNLDVVLENNNIQGLGNITKNIKVTLSEQQLRGLIKERLLETFDHIDEMIDSSDRNPPDTVILAGQSSKMPMVKEMIKTHFQKYKKQVDIHIADDPKACVVRGAAQYSLTQILPAGQWQIRSSIKTYSRFGIARMDGVRPIFEEIIPKGRKIPDESYGETVFPLAARTVNFDVREHPGTDNVLENASEIANYTLQLPQELPDTALKKSNLKMVIKEDNEIELIADIGGREYKSTVEKKAPPFVDKI